MNHSDYITHLKNDEDYPYLRKKHFPVNMRLFKTSSRYRKLIQDQCHYIEFLCLTKMDGYKKPHGMSSANAGLAFNIIGVTRNRNTPDEYCMIMINPTIIRVFGDRVKTQTNCGSLTLPEPITITRFIYVEVSFYDINGRAHKEIFDRESGSFTIQHEIDHNLGVLITDRLNNYV